MGQCTGGGAAHTAAARETGALLPLAATHIWSTPASPPPQASPAALLHIHGITPSLQHIPPTTRSSPAPRPGLVFKAGAGSRMLGCLVAACSCRLWRPRLHKTSWHAPATPPWRQQQACSPHGTSPCSPHRRQRHALWDGSWSNVQRSTLKCLHFDHTPRAPHQ